MNKVLDAQREYRRAAEALIGAVQKEFPVGCVVSVILGKNLLRLEVTGHNQSWWYEPGQIYGRNIFTGKQRKFSPSAVRFVVEKPGGEQE